MQLNGSVNNLLCVFYKYLPMYFMNLHVSGKLEIMIHHQSFISFKNTFLVCKSMYYLCLMKCISYLS